ncbi:hypothetical protein AVEN_118785-1 [Araneus ventricosus]|uniref:Uncharacterized protein n=1 Tax=Araneus ventricosus TaxID=182803 RepID=A0A4Y2BVN2_ARAVE|nr:hypothetical protein AVEN_118785-1 [Araneus ventricosus]
MSASPLRLSSHRPSSPYVCVPSPQRISMKFFSFSFGYSRKILLLLLFQPETLSPKSVKISVLPSCTSHFESPGEDRQATPNRQIFKRGKGTVRIQTFLAKESQPRQVESEWIEHAVDCPHFTQSERGSLIADQRASFNFNWEEREF